MIKNKLCRNCNKNSLKMILDLGFQPHSNALTQVKGALIQEEYFPLQLAYCKHCFFCQLTYDTPPIVVFNESYVYRSSQNKGFVKHANKFVNDVIPELNNFKDPFVVEAASNDGYLLQFFKKKNINCLGIEPSASAATEAINKQIETIVDFFSEDTAKKIVKDKGKASLFIGNNVLAHVPDINDFIKAISILLDDEGIASLEFPHLENLIHYMQFDTIYHEHYSYISLNPLMKTFKRNGLKLINVKKVFTHGGSLRIMLSKISSKRKIQPSVKITLDNEIKNGLLDAKTYEGWNKRVRSICIDFFEFVVMEIKKGKKFAGFGAAAKGNVFLNSLGINNFFIPIVFDDTLAKQNKFLPGSRIPIKSVQNIKKMKPDYIIILPWNWEKEIIERLAFARNWGCKFVIAIPELRII